jgi:hypothetical protein
MSCKLSVISSEKCKKIEGVRTFLTYALRLAPYALRLKISLGFGIWDLILWNFLLILPGT